MKSEIWNGVNGRKLYILSMFHWPEQEVDVAGQTWNLFGDRIMADKWNLAEEGRGMFQRRAGSMGGWSSVRRRVVKGGRFCFGFVCVGGGSKRKQIG